MKQAKDRVREKRDRLLGWVRRSNSKAPSPVAQHDTDEPLERVSEARTHQHGQSSSASSAGRSSPVRAHDISELDQLKELDTSSTNVGSGNGAFTSTAHASQHGDPAEEPGVPITNVGVSGMSLWQRAMDQLSSDERRVFVSVIGDMENLAGEDVFHALEEATQAKKLEIVEKECSIGERNSLRSVVSTTIVCLRRFKEVGDIAVSFDPTHAALPWAAFRFILEAITVDDTQLQLILSGVEKSSYLALRGRVYQQLYNSTSQSLDIGLLSSLESALLSLYREILGFLALAIKRFRKSHPGRAMAALFNPEEVSERLQRMDNAATETDREASNCNRWMNMTGRDRLYDLMDKRFVSVEAKAESLYLKLEAKEHTKALRWISPLAYVSDHETAREGRVGGTGDWLLQRSELQKWYQDKGSGIFWLHGIPGAGKTKLSTKVVDYVSFDLKANQSLAYFYCDKNREDHRSPGAVLRSLVRQLSVSDNGINVHTYDAWRKNHEMGGASGEPNWELCHDLLLHLISDHERTTLVLDGLDECNSHTRHWLIQLLNGIVQRKDLLVKVFIASRNDRDLWENYVTGPRFNITANDNIEDIRRYVLNTLDTTSNTWWRQRLPKETKDILLGTFETQSEGMFQWAVLQMKMLLEMERDIDVRAHLGSLPKGLEAAYENILEDISLQAGSKPVIASRALKWIQKSWRPLHPSELAALVCQSGEELADFDPDVDISYILASCRNLLVVTSTHPVICRFSHLSVQDHLDTHSWKNQPDDLLLGAVCLQILMSPTPVDEVSSGPPCLQYPEDEGSSFERRAIPLQYLHADSEYLDTGDEECLNEGGSTQSKFLREAEAILTHLRTITTFQSDATEPIHQLEGALIAQKSQSDFLKDYTDHWYIHIIEHNSENGTKDTRRLIQQLIEQFLGDPAAGSLSYWKWLYGIQHEDLRLPISTEFDKRLWLDHGPAFGAVALGLKSVIVSWLDSHAVDPNLSCDSGSLFHLAAMRLSPDICDVLLRYGANVNALCPRGTTPLLVALANGTDEMVGYLIKAANADVNHGNHGTFSALGFAAFRRSPEVVKLLLESGGNIHAPGFTSPLHAAIDKRWLGPEMMRLLLANGADPDFDDDHYGTPLQHAVRQFNTWAVDLLIQHGADVNLGRPLYSVLAGMEDRKGSKILRRLVNAGALDYALSLPPEQMTHIDKVFRLLAEVVRSKLSGEVQFTVTC